MLCSDINDAMSVTYTLLLLFTSQYGVFYCVLPKKHSLNAYHTVLDREISNESVKHPALAYYAMFRYK